MICSPFSSKSSKHHNDDPDNYCGIEVGSCFCKLFSKLLNIRLEQKVVSQDFISVNQGSGKKGSWTADHLLIVKFLIDKCVNIKGGKLFVCFVDLKNVLIKLPRICCFIQFKQKPIL